MSVLRLLEAAGPTAAAFIPTTWNPSDKNANVTLSSGNLTLSSSSLGGARSIHSANSGKWYFEITYTALTAVSSNTAIGVANASNTLNGGVSSDGVVSMGGGTGAIWVGGTDSGIAMGPVNQPGRVYGIAVDIGASRFWIRNASDAPTSWNAGAGNPASGTGAINAAAIFGPSTPVYAWANAYSGDGAQLTGNFGATAFTAAAPSGFNPGF